MPTTIIPHNNIRSNKRYIIPKGQSKMNNAEKRATQGTQGEEKQNNNTNAGHHNTHTNTNNVNKT